MQQKKRRMQSVLKRIGRKIGKYVHRPPIKIRKTDNLIFMGTPYGGRGFLEIPQLHGSTIISAGLGEDASFDVEFGTKYNAKILLVDPTPRAIAHYRAMKERFGRKAEMRYVKGGKQPVESYDMEQLSLENFDLIEKALWIDEGSIQFFAPPDPQHVSYSIDNFQNNYSRETPHIDVASTTLEAIMSSYKLTRLETIKLDIEGAANPVIHHMLNNHITPNQILAEFEELSNPSRTSTEKFLSCDAKMRQHGYECIWWDGWCDFAYAHQRILNS